MLSVIVAVVCSSLSDVYVEKVLNFVAFSLERSAHLQFYLSWAQQLLLQHTHKLKNRLVPLMLLIRFDSGRFNSYRFCLACRSLAILPTLHALQKSIKRHSNNLSKL